MITSNASNFNINNILINTFPMFSDETLELQYKNLSMSRWCIININVLFFLIYFFHNDDNTLFLNIYF